MTRRAGNTEQEAHTAGTPAAARGGRMMMWLKRLGVGGFIFFLVKGLLWLIVPYIIAKVW